MLDATTRPGSDGIHSDSTLPCPRPAGTTGPSMRVKSRCGMAAVAIGDAFEQVLAARDPLRRHRHLDVGRRRRRRLPQVEVRQPAGGHEDHNREDAEQNPLEHGVRLVYDAFHGSRETCSNLVMDVPRRSFLLATAAAAAQSAWGQDARQDADRADRNRQSRLLPPPGRSGAARRRSRRAVRHQARPPGQGRQRRQARQSEDLLQLEGDHRPQGHRRRVHRDAAVPALGNGSRRPEERQARVLRKARRRHRGPGEERSSRPPGRRTRSSPPASSSAPSGSSPRPSSRSTTA